MTKTPRIRAPGPATLTRDKMLWLLTSLCVAIGRGMRAVIGLICIGFPSAYCGSPDNDMSQNIAAYLAKGEQLNKELFSKMPLVTPIIAPHAPYTCGVDGMEQCKRMSEKLGIGIHVHLCETCGEVKDWKTANSDKTPIKSLEEVGVFSDKMVAVHMTNVEDEEMDMLAAKGVSVCHCPESNMKLASGACQVATPPPAPLAIGPDQNYTLANFPRPVAPHDTFVLVLLGLHITAPCSTAQHSKAHLSPSPARVYLHLFPLKPFALDAVCTGCRSASFLSLNPNPHTLIPEP